MKGTTKTSADQPDQASTAQRQRRARRYLDLWERHLALLATRGADKDEAAR